MPLCLQGHMAASLNNHGQHALIKRSGKVCQSRDAKVLALLHKPNLYRPTSVKLSMLRPHLHRCFCTKQRPSPHACAHVCRAATHRQRKAPTARVSNMHHVLGCMLLTQAMGAFLCRCDHLTNFGSIWLGVGMRALASTFGSEENVASGPRAEKEK